MTKQLKVLMLGTTEGPDDKAAEDSDDEAAVRITEGATR
jgi:hypothetical protein